MKTIEETYLSLFWIWQRWAWENYSGQGKHYLEDIDREMYRLMQHLPQFTALNRNEELLNTIILRTLVDKHPLVSKLRNRLDSWDYYLSDLSPQSKKEKNNLKKTLADKMRGDVLKLMEIRNRLANRAGFISYPALVYACDEMDPQLSLRIVNQYLSQHKIEVREIIRKNQFSWATWSSDLNTLGAGSPFNPYSEMKNILCTLGYEKLIGKIQIHIQKDGFGYTGYWNQEQTAHILLAPPTNLRHKLTFYHELGHALSHCLNQQNGLLHTWHAVFDESMAVLFEHLAVELFLSKAEQSLAHQIIKLEYCRCALSAQFEHDLWGNPDHADQLYQTTYAQLGLPITEPYLWTLDSFRSVDPVYIQNYVIGADLAEKILRSHQLSPPEWGEFLYDHFYANGLAVPFQTLLATHTLFLT